MAVSKAIRWSNVARRWLAVIVLAGSGFAADRAGADIIKKEDTLRGITMTRAQCDAIPQTLWLKVDNQDFCVRYYLSTAGGEGSRPIVFWNGDSNGPVDITRDRTGKVTFTWHDPSRAADADTDAFMEIADHFSKMARTTAIYIGRIGVEGTSGSHLSRKTYLELHLMNAALNALKQHYGFEGFHLTGESGGARIAFGVAGTRRDIGCLVSASGQLADVRNIGKIDNPGRTYFNINVPALAHNHAMRLMAVTDPHDQQVPAAQEQTPVMVKLRQAGGMVFQYFVQSTSANHHGVLEYAELVTAGCVLGKTFPDIWRATFTQIRRNVLLNRRTQDMAKAKAARLTH